MIRPSLKALDADQSAVAAVRRRSRRSLLLAFLRVPLAEKLAIIPTWLLMGFAAMALRIAPFSRLAPLLGRRASLASPTPAISTAHQDRARFIRRAIERAVRLAPFRSNCLPQALVCGLLCRWLHIPAVARLGVQVGTSEADERMKAHAWVMAGGYPIVGGRGSENYTVVATFLIHDG